MSIRSILDSADPPTAVRFHVLSNGLADDDREVLRQTVAGADTPGEISFLEFDTGAVRHLQRSRLITHTAYARLFLGSMLPQDVHRCVYVDCDLIFNRDVGELWRIDLGDCCVGAVDNGLWDDSEKYQRRLGLDAAEYFNSGVMLIDMSRWREREIGARAMEFALRVGDALVLHDQDALNGALQGDWLRLPPHWNLWVVHPELERDSQAVFHYMGAPKPWHPDYSGRFGQKFLEYLDRTPFAGHRPWNPVGVGAWVARTRRRIPYLPSAVRVLRTRLRSQVADG